MKKNCPVPTPQATCDAATTADLFCEAQGFSLALRYGLGQAGSSQTVLLRSAVLSPLAAAPFTKQTGTPLTNVLCAKLAPGERLGPGEQRTLHGHGAPPACTY